MNQIDFEDKNDYEYFLNLKIFLIKLILQLFLS